MSSRVSIGPLLGLVIVIAPDLASAGAWTLPEGKGHAALIGTWTNATRTFDSGGHRLSAPLTNKFELQGLLEYGATDRFTVMLLPSLQHVAIGAPVDAQRSGLGYFEAGGRYRVFEGPSWVMSAQATMRAPGVFAPVNPAAIGYSEPEADLRALFGTSGTVAGWPAYIDLQLAQRFRIGGPPNEFRADLTFGLRPWPAWMLVVQSFNVFAEEARLPTFPSYAYHKFQVSVVYDLSAAWSVQFGTFTTLGGRSALLENGILFGTWYRF